MNVVTSLTALIVSKLSFNKSSRRRKLARSKSGDQLEIRLVLSGTSVTDSSAMPASQTQDSMMGSTAPDSTLNTTPTDSLSGTTSMDSLPGTTTTDPTVTSSPGDSVFGSTGSDPTTTTLTMSVEISVQNDGSRKVVLTISGLPAGTTATLVFDGVLDGNSISVNGSGEYQLQVDPGITGSAEVELRSANNTALDTQTFNLA